MGRRRFGPQTGDWTDDSAAVPGLEDRFAIETTSAGDGLTHQLWNRK